MFLYCFLDIYSDVKIVEVIMNIIVYVKRIFFSFVILFC